jgi:bifunctional DNA-binding transcriptional regulator/antitoxin component of YhaV-PrlF toxin-antitoxin module
VEAVTILIKYRAAIPREVRQQFNLKPEQQIILILRLHSKKIALVVYRNWVIEVEKEVV